MAIYACKIKGADGPIVLIKGKSQKQALDELVEAKSVSAEEMADLLAKGAKMHGADNQAEAKSAE